MKNSNLVLGLMTVVGAGCLAWQVGAEEPAAITPAGKAGDAAAQPAPAALPQAFQPITVDQEAVRRGMQMRSELNELDRKIEERQKKLYEENATIKDLQIQMRELQKKIDALLASDAELSALKAKLETRSKPDFGGAKTNAPAAPSTSVEKADPDSKK